MLFDFGSGDDLYESLRFSQGSGMLGAGVLYDEGGTTAPATTRPTGASSPPRRRRRNDHRSGRLALALPSSDKLASSAVFADGAGIDTYERVRAFQPEPLANAKSWVHPWLKDALQPNTPMPASPSYASPTVFGVGIDR